MFKRLLSGLFLAVLVLAMAVVPARAAEARLTTDPVIVASQKTDSWADGPHFFADRRVELKDDYLGSVYVAGGDVEITGAIDGDLIVAGSSIVIAGSVTQDVYAAGGTVTVTGNIGGNLTVAGGEVIIADTGKVAQAVIAGARVYRQSGTVLGDVLAGAQDANLDGAVGQSARFEADRLNISDRAVVGEQLTAEVRREANISDAAKITGERNVTVKPQTKYEKKISPISWSAHWLLSLVGRLIVMTLAVALFGQVLKRAGAVFDRRWPDAFWKGAAFTVLVPFLVLALVITIIGLPAAMTVGLLYILVMTTAWVVPGFWLGQRLVPKTSLYLQGAAGAAIISLVGVIPILGWLVRFLLAVLGVGALLNLWRRAGK